MEYNNNIVLPSTVYNIGIENELRFVVGEERTVSLELLTGLAEVLGSELDQNTVYTFPPYSSVAVFSWQGCRVKLSGKVENVHVTSKSLIMISVNVHACLEERRLVAESKNGKGPISLVAGPMQSGKSSFCHVLLNYAARLGRKPLYIDLDVANNTTSVPGAMSVLLVENPSHASEGFTGDVLSVFPFGYMHPKKNIPLYNLLIKNLGKLFQERLWHVNTKIRSSGVVIDTCGWVRQQGYAALTLAAYAFEIDVLFVIDDENLYLRLKKDMPRSVKVVYLPKREGVIKRGISLCLDIQDNRLWEYFFGSIKRPLKPFEFDVKFSDIEIYSARSQTCGTDIFNTEMNDVETVKVRIEPVLVNNIFGLSFADAIDEHFLVTNVKGFICFVKVDMDKEVVTVLSPQPGPLPSKFLVMADIKLRRIKNCNVSVFNK